MITSRDPADLHPVVRGMYEQHFQECKQRGYDIILTCTYRDAEAQDALYKQGRFGNKGNIVTNAKAGESFHNWRCAYDIVPVINGKPIWSTSGDGLIMWTQVGILGKLCGLEWAGDWKSFKEFPHFQWSNGLTINDLKNGKALPDVLPERKP